MDLFQDVLSVISEAYTVNSGKPQSFLLTYCGCLNYVADELFRVEFAEPLIYNNNIYNNVCVANTSSCSVIDGQSLPSNNQATPELTRGLGEA